MSDLYTVYNSPDMGPIFRIVDGGEFHGTVFQFSGVDFEEGEDEMVLHYSTCTVGWRSDEGEKVYVENFSPEFYNRLKSEDYDNLCGVILEECLKKEVEARQKELQKEAE